MDIKKNNYIKFLVLKNFNKKTFKEFGSTFFDAERFLKKFKSRSQMRHFYNCVIGHYKSQIFILIIKHLRSQI